jgi:septal ring-binding cell division protein DamX
MANLALNAKTVTAIWAGLSLLALAVFAMGFVSGAYWSDMSSTGDVTAAVTMSPEKPAPKAPEPEPTAQAEPQKQVEPEPAVSEPEPVASEPTPSANPEPQAAPEPPAKENQVAATSPVPAVEPEKPQAAQPSPEPQATPKPEPAATPKQNSALIPAGEVFFVQVASFRSLERAADMYAELAAKGHDASVFTVFDNDDQPWYVLKIGEYATREQAEAAGAEYRIREGASFTVRGFDAALLRVRTIPTESLPLEAER